MTARRRRKLPALAKVIAFSAPVKETPANKAYREAEAAMDSTVTTLGAARTMLTAMDRALEAMHHDYRWALGEVDLAARDIDALQDYRERIAYLTDA